MSVCGRQIGRVSRIYQVDFAEEFRFRLLFTESPLVAVVNDICWVTLEARTDLRSRLVQ